MSKTASELLLEINDKLDKLLQIVNNHDMLLKVLNNKFQANNIKAPTTHSDVQTLETTTPVIEEIKRPNIPGLKPGVVLTRVGETSVLVNEKNIDVTKSETVKTETKSGKPANLKQPKTIGVQQRIVYKDGKSIILAVVRIFKKSRSADNNIFEELVVEKKTNAAGKWMAALEPGNYEVKVFKYGVDKDNIDTTFPIVITDNNAPITLETKML